MPTHLAQEWSAGWPLPAVALALLVVLSFLRPVVDSAERGRVKAGIFFAGAYLLMQLAFALFHRPLPAPGQHDWLRVLSVLLLCFAMVIAASLLLFDLVLRRRQIPRILQDLLQAVAYFIVAAIVLTRSDVDVTRVFTASVLTTAVIGLALQDTLGNIMAGLALQLERDFEVGDWINVGDRTSMVVGRIDQVRWRATTIVTRNGDLMLIPNSTIARAMITNFNRPTSAHRQWVNVRVHFRHPPARVREVIVDAVRALSFVRAEPSPDCLLLEFKEDACTYACRYWIDDVQRDEIFDSDVRSAIWYALHRAGMEIPFPSHNVHVTEMTEDRMQRKRDEEHARRVDALSRVDVFRALDAGGIDRLARRLRQGEPGDSLYVVRRGSVAVQIGVQGASKDVAALGEGDFFGEMSLMTGALRTATVVAKTDVECHVVDKEAFQEIVREKPDLAGTISDILSRRQVDLGVMRKQTPVPSAAQTNQLRSKIAAFFGLGGGKPRS